MLINEKNVKVLKLEPQGQTNDSLTLKAFTFSKSYLEFTRNFNRNRKSASLPLWWSFQYAICLSDKTLEQSARRFLLSEPLEITY